MRLKTNWILFALFFVVAVGYRSYQVFNLIDPDTGFLPVSDKYSLYIMLGVIVVFSILIYIFGSKKKMIETTYKLRQNVLAGVFALIASAMVIIYSINVAFSSDYSTPQVVNVLYIIFGVLAGIQLLINAISLFIGKNLFEKCAVLTVAFPLWLCLKAVHLTFIEYKNIMNISGCIIDVLSVVAMILFFFAYAKLLSGVSTQKTLKRTFGIGLATLICLSVNTLPNIASSIINGNYSSFKSMIGDITNITILLFCFCLVIELSLVIKENLEEPEENKLVDILKNDENERMKRKFATIEQLNDLSYSSEDGFYDEKADKTEIIPEKKEEKIEDNKVQQKERKNKHEVKDETKIDDVEDIDLDITTEMGNNDVDMNYIDSLIDDILSEDK